MLPPPPPPADFFTVTPCRLVDTRNAAGPSGGPALTPGAIRSFPVTGGVCGIPSTAIAVSVNLTVTQPAAQGYLILYPGDAAGPPLASNINFTPGLTRANNAIVLLATNGGTINVKNGSAGIGALRSGRERVLPVDARRSRGRSRAPRTGAASGTPRITEAE